MEVGRGFFVFVVLIFYMSDSMFLCVQGFCRGLVPVNPVPGVGASGAQASFAQTIDPQWGVTFWPESEPWNFRELGQETVVLEVWTWSTPLKSFPVFRSEPHILVPCFSTLDTKAQTFPKVNRRKVERCFFLKEIPLEMRILSCFLLQNQPVLINLYLLIIIF